MSYQNNFKQFLSSSQAESENMTQKEMDDLQEAINQSKETATLEEHQREMDKKFTKSSTNSDDAFEEHVKEKSTPKNLLKKAKTLAGLKSEKELSSQELKITFQDLLEVSGKSLDIVYHPPLYDLPIVTDPQYKGYSIQQKTKWLFNYYTNVDKLRTQLAKQSFFRAPYPKPILPSNKFKNSLLKNGLDDENGTLDDFFEQSEQQELYVSRGGRQLKRKIYTEDAEVDSDPDFNSSNKKNKINDSNTKITLDTPYKPEENHSEDKSKPVKTRKDTPRRPSSLSMKKSLGRSDLMFEKLIEDTEKKKQQQEEMENFEKTLPSYDEAEEDEFLIQGSSTAEVTEDSDANFIRKRVSPPLPNIKKGGRGKKAVKQDNNKNEKKLESPSGSPILKRYTNLNKNTENNPKTKLKSQKSLENIEVEESSSKILKMPCPICNKEFAQNVIENHASTCGIDEQPHQSFGNVSENTRETMQSMTCGLCDRVFLTPTKYELHMKHCVAETVKEM